MSVEVQRPNPWSTYEALEKWGAELDLLTKQDPNLALENIRKKFSAAGRPFPENLTVDTLPQFRMGLLVKKIESASDGLARDLLASTERYKTDPQYREELDGWADMDYYG